MKKLFSVLVLSVALCGFTIGCQPSDSAPASSEPAAPAESAPAATDAPAAADTAPAETPAAPSQG